MLLTPGKVQDTGCRMQDDGEPGSKAWLLDDAGCRIQAAAKRESRLLGNAGCVLNKNPGTSEILDAEYWIRDTVIHSEVERKFHPFGNIGIDWLDRCLCFLFFRFQCVLCGQLFFLCLALFFSLVVFVDDIQAQEGQTDYSAGISLAGGSPELPFWLYANSDARLRLGSSGNGLVSVGLHHRFLEEDSWFQVRAGADLFSRISNRQNTVHFQQFYVEADYRKLRLTIGNFYDPVGINESDLSIGSMMVSRNATPMPRIRLSTPEYVSVPGTNDFFQFKARYSEGLLESDRVVPDPNLHQKYLYLRLNPDERISLYGGIVHNLVWGGTDETGRRFFSSFRNYIKSVLAIPRDDGPTPAGNALAAYDFAAEYRTDNYRFKASRLFFLEDLISARFRSPWDGVWGLSISKHNREGLFHSLHYQHINTKRQDSRGGQPPGRARYYWNVFYQSGWTYQGAVLGIPLITFDEDGNLGNNMLVGHHLGFAGDLADGLEYKVFLTYTRNYGNCLDVQPDFERLNQCLIPADQDLDEITIVPLSELRRDQYSMMAETSYRLPRLQNLQLQLRVALDTGRLYNDRLGIMAGLRWDGSL